MISKIVAWNNFDRSQFASVNGSKLDLYCITQAVDGSRRASVVGTRDNKRVDFTCAQWYPHEDKQRLMACGMNNSVVGLIDWASDSNEIKEINPASAARRPCSGLSWNLLNKNYLAASFDKHQRDNSSVVVWDIETCKPTVKLADEPITSLSWISTNPHLLALGAPQGWVKIYDIRKTNVSNIVGNNNSPDMSIIAHGHSRTKVVKGIRGDPRNDYLIATFSDSIGEFVKVWDLRFVEKANTKLSTQTTINPYCGVYDQMVLDIAWSSERQNTMAVALSRCKSIGCFDTARPLSSEADGTNSEPITKTPLYSVDVGDYVRAFSWQQKPVVPEMKPGEQFNVLPFENRMLICTFNSGFLDTPIVDNVALSISPSGVCAINTGKRGGLAISIPKKLRLANQLNMVDVAASDGLGAKVLASFGTMNLSLADAEKGAAVAENLTSLTTLVSHIHTELSNNWLEIDTVMKRRSLSGYQMDASKNCELLSDELDALRLFEITLQNLKNAHNARANTSKGAEHEAVSGLIQRNFKLVNYIFAEVSGLFRVWNWIARVDEAAAYASPGVGLSLQRGGVWQVLTNPTGVAPVGSDSGTEVTFTSDVSTSPTLGIPVYTIKQRATVLNICGWISKEFTFTSSSVKVGDTSVNGGNWNLHSSTGHLSEDSTNNASASASDELRNYVEEVEHTDCFERSVFIAVMHGNIELGVEILRKHIDFYEELKKPSHPVATELGATSSSAVTTTSLEKSAVRASIAADVGAADSGLTLNEASLDDYYGNDITNEYIQLMSLVAMCFAGFPNPAGKSANSSTSTWTSMCQYVISLLNQCENRKEAIYLAAVCNFLLKTITMASGAMDRYGAVLLDTKIFIEDRIAFACVYLSDAELSQYLKYLGSIPISGLVVTGFNEDGIALLQEYLDQVQDIQSVGLLIGRYLSEIPPASAPTSASANNSNAQSNSNIAATYDTKEKYWFYEYRLLLNKWQLFIQRAAIDVEFAKKQRAFKSKARPSSTGASGSTSTAGPRTMSSGRGAGSFQKNVPAARTMYCMPTYTSTPHIYLRCHYCSSSLPLDPMHSHMQQSWLRRQSPIIECCPNCKKPLPRCYICRLRVGLLNPQLEFQRLQQALRTKKQQLNEETQRQLIAATSVSESGHGHGTMSPANVSQAHSHGGGAPPAEDSVIAAGKWLYFCQKCKHGGHANCIDQWFQIFGQVKCGVNGCACVCI